jgi:hypothetical protein
MMQMHLSFLPAQGGPQQNKSTGQKERVDWWGKRKPDRMVPRGKKAEGRSQKQEARGRRGRRHHLPAEAGTTNCRLKAGLRTGGGGAVWGEVGGGGRSFAPAGARRGLGDGVPWRRPGGAGLAMG